MAVADSVKNGIIPIAEADDIFICVGVFIHWEASDDEKIQDFKLRGDQGGAQARDRRRAPRRADARADGQGQPSPSRRMISAEFNPSRPPAKFAMRSVSQSQGFAFARPAVLPIAISR